MKKMQKKVIQFVVLTGIFLTSIPLFAQERKTVYISPNNDGVQDALIIPIKISDTRYIEAWSLVIQDEKGKTVRTIGNKVALPEKLTLKGFFKQLITPKHGVAIPETVTWNGVMDNGETAPDGNYYYYFTATDDNGNVGYAPDIKTTSPLKVIVDNTAPTVEIAKMTAADLIFGEGNKTEIDIKQNGSKEDLWSGKITDINGDVVRSIKWTDSAPLSFSWGGASDKGMPVADGVYSYSITATDRAGNVSAPAGVANMIFSAEKPAANITIDGSRYFSPETKSSQKSVTLDVTIPLPHGSSGNKLVSWNIDIQGTDGKTLVAYKSDKSTAENPPKTIVFDGKNSSGQLIPEGNYKARVVAKYLNGYETTPVYSPVFVLDTTDPSAELRTSDSIFSPDGDGSKDSITITQLVVPEKGSPVKNWTGKIVSASDDSVVTKNFDLGEYPSDEIVWNGQTDDGKLAADGSYKYILTATDLAGNACKQESKPFKLDTSKTEVILALSDTAFSPNNDNVKDKMSFTVVAKTKSSVSDYSFNVLDSTGKIVHNIKAKSALPGQFTWDGKDNTGIICKDGVYTAELNLDSESGAHVHTTTQPFTLDTKAPSLTVSVPWSSFSPDGDGLQDAVSVVTDKMTDEDLWTAEVLDANKKIVKTYTWQHSITTDGKNGFEWPGIDESGNNAGDGTYSIKISSEDKAGNAFSTIIAGIVLDSRTAKAYVTASETGISPNADKYKDVQVFNIKTTLDEGISSWTFDIKSAAGKTVRSWSNKDQANVPAEIKWDGYDASGKVAEGTYAGYLAIKYAKGNYVTAATAPFLCSVTPPALKVATAPQYFSPDNDGTDDDLFIKLSGKSMGNLTSWSFTINNPNDTTPFWKVSGTSSITERLIWNGTSNVSKNSKGKAERVQSAMDYPWHFTVTDDLGMTSTLDGKIAVDVLVIRDGNLLKMAVPSIIFRSNNADFKTSKEIKGGLDPAKAANNERVLKRVAEILNKFQDYKVTVVGHANRMTDNPKEETVDNPRVWGKALTPLSQERAEYVKQYLISHGVSASRLTSLGKGGTEPVVDPKDKQNNWKNRRVEFILVK